MRLTAAQVAALRILASLASGASLGPGRGCTSRTLFALTERKLARRTDVPFHSATDRPRYAITDLGREVLASIV